jgi:hypothetical protein
MSVTGDLFSATQELAQVPMQDAEVYYLCHLPLSEPADEILQYSNRSAKFKYTLLG